MNSREVMQQALEAIRIFREWETGQDYESCRATVLARALAAEESLGAALAEFGAEPTKEEQTQIESKQEPVAWPCHIIEADFSERTITLGMESGDYKVSAGTHYLSTAQPPRKPLTDEEIIAANYPDGEEVEPLIAAPDSELIAFSRAVMAVQRDKKGRPIAYWSGLTEARKDDTTRPQRQPQEEPVAKVELMTTGGNAGACPSHRAGAWDYGRKND